MNGKGYTIMEEDIYTQEYRVRLDNDRRKTDFMVSADQMVEWGQLLSQMHKQSDFLSAYGDDFIDYLVGAGNIDAAEELRQLLKDRAND